jgi:hypothetical protein
LDAYAASRILGLVPQSLPRVGLFRFPSVGGPAVSSAAVTLLASRIRTSVSTCVSWVECSRLLSSSEYRSLNASIGDQFWPSFWLGRPFAFSCKDAYELSIVPFSAQPAVAEVVRRWRLKRLHGLQRSVTRSLHDSIHVFDFGSVFRVRFDSVFPFGSGDRIDWSCIAKLLRQLKSYAACAVVKTLLNSWTTSARLHECTVQPCLFGCSPSTRNFAQGSFFDRARDELQHYVVCRRLMCNTSLAQIPFDIFWKPAATCGLDPPCVDGLRTVAVSFYTYHSAKFDPSCDGSIGLAGRVRAGRHAIA